MLKRLCCVKPFLHIFTQQVLKQILTRLRTLGGPLNILTQYRLLHLLPRLTKERQATRHYHVKNDTEGPDIALRSIVAHEDFRCHEVRRAGHLMQLLISLYSKPKIDQANLPRLIIHNIGRLDIPMQNVLRMAVVNRFQKLL